MVLESGVHTMDYVWRHHVNVSEPISTPRHRFNGILCYLMMNHDAAWIAMACARDTLFQQDNARCHTTRVSMGYLDEQYVSVLPWPAFSPDLSPIEHLWDVLDRCVRRRDPQNVDQLKKFLRQEWEAISLHEIQHVIWSMRRYCTTVVNVNREHTRYITLFEMTPVWSVTLIRWTRFDIVDVFLNEILLPKGETFEMK